MSFAVPSIKPSFQRPSSRVAIRCASSYDMDLTEMISETLAEFDFDVKGKNVLLKANFVGADAQHVMNTHPSVVAAARASFLRLDAATVVVGEGPALERDTEAILEAIGLRKYLGPLDRTFVDLNVDDVRPVTLRTRASSLKRLHLPATVLRADFVVSMPKLKLITGPELRCRLRICSASFPAIVTAGPRTSFIGRGFRSQFWT